MKKNKYDTFVVMLYQLGMENSLPIEFRKQIPYSTICSWRKSDYKSFTGHEYRKFFMESLVFSALKQKHRQALKTLSALKQSWAVVKRFMPLILQEAKSDVELQKHLLELIAILKEYFWNEPDPTAAWHP